MANLADKQRDLARARLDQLIALIKSHRCSSDGAMLVEQCVESGRCGCTVGAVINDRASEDEG